MKNIYTRHILVFTFCLCSLFSLAQDPQTKASNPDHRFAQRSGRSHAVAPKLSENEILAAELARKEKANKEQKMKEKAKKDEELSVLKEVELRKNIKTKEDVQRYENKKPNDKK